jgi:hypothetical protein
MSKEIKAIVKYYEISEETIGIFSEIVRKKVLNDVAFHFIGNSSQKTVCKISKLSDQYEYMLNKHILVSINEELMVKFDDESINILFEQEIDKISFNIETGKVKLIKPDIATFSSLIKKWGIEKISRANQLADITKELTVSTDFENDFIS